MPIPIGDSPIIDSQTATLIAAGIAAIASLAALTLSSRLTFDRERRQAIIHKEIDRLFGVEELAGRVTELVGSYQSVEEKRERLGLLFTELDSAAGQVSRYSGVQQALRNVSNTSKRLYSCQFNHEDDRAVRAELQPAYHALTIEVDRILRPARLFHKYLGRAI